MSQRVKKKRKTNYRRRQKLKGRKRENRPSRR